MAGKNPKALTFWVNTAQNTGPQAPLPPQLPFGQQGYQAPNARLGPNAGPGPNALFGSSAGPGPNAGFGSIAGPGPNTGYGSIAGLGANAGYGSITGPGPNSGFGASAGPGPNAGFGSNTGPRNVQFPVGPQQTTLLGFPARPEDVNAEGYFDQQTRYSAEYGPTPPVTANFTRPRRSTDDVFEMGREMGRLESEITLLQKQVRFHEGEAARYRLERDEVRAQVTQSNQKIANLTGQIAGLQVQGQKLASPGVSYHTPLRRKPQGLLQEPSKSAPALTRKLAGVTKSPGPFSPKRPLAITQGPATLPSYEAANSSAMGFYCTNLGQILGPLFNKFETWAAQYGTEAVLSLRLVGPAGNLVGIIDDICRDRKWEDLVQKPHLRRLLIVAVINYHVMPFLGANFLGCLPILATHPALAEVLDAIKSMPPQQTAQYNELLERRARVTRAIMTEYAEYGIQLEGKIKKVTDDITTLLEVLIPVHGAAAASKGLRDLVREAFAVGQRMMLTSREWNITMGQRGDRWDPQYMIQKDDTWVDDPKLTDAYGFHYVVRLGISPSVTEKDYSTGTLNLREVYPKTVLLMYNSHQRTPPSGSQRK